MFETTINWEDDTYIVREDNEFIHDTDDLHEALAFALECSEHSGNRVVVESIAP